eukprot:2068037-Prymnesium_polylepis.2
MVALTARDSSPESHTAVLVLAATLELLASDCWTSASADTAAPDVTLASEDRSLITRKTKAEMSARVTAGCRIWKRVTHVKPTTQIECEWAIRHICVALIRVAAHCLLHSCREESQRLVDHGRRPSVLARSARREHAAAPGQRLGGHVVGCARSTQVGHGCLVHSYCKRSLHQLRVCVRQQGKRGQIGGCWRWQGWRRRRRQRVEHVHGACVQAILVGSFCVCGGCGAAILQVGAHSEASTICSHSCAEAILLLNIHCTCALAATVRRSGIALDGRAASLTLCAHRQDALRPVLGQCRSQTEDTTRRRIRGLQVRLKDPGGAACAKDVERTCELAAVVVRGCKVHTCGATSLIPRPDSERVACELECPLTKKIVRATIRALHVCCKTPQDARALARLKMYAAPEKRHPLSAAATDETAVVQLSSPQAPTTTTAPAAPQPLSAAAVVSVELEQLSSLGAEITRVYCGGVPPTWRARATAHPKELPVAAFGALRYLANDHWAAVRV